MTSRSDRRPIIRHRVTTFDKKDGGIAYAHVSLPAPPDWNFELAEDNRKPEPAPRTIRGARKWSEDPLLASVYRRVNKG